MKRNQMINAGNLKKKGGVYSMKKTLVVLLTVCFLMVAVSAFATIANTKHNLTSTSTAPTKTTAGAATLCGFCHVPHGGSTAVTGLPLWGRTTPSGPYTLYGGGATLAGTSLAGGPGTYSLTCLSCHDGTIGLGTVTKNGVSTTFAMTGNVNANGTIRDDSNATAYNPLIGTDLRNDHPIGFTYVNPAGGIPGINLTITTPGTSTARLIGTSGVYPLFQAGGTDRFECASCHDPHLEDNPGVQTSFLRGVNADLCQDCHNTK